MPTRPLFAACAALVLALFAIVAAGCQGNVFSLKVGDCFDGVAAGQVADVNKVDCAAPHDSEVFSVFDYPNAPADFPGTDAINTAAGDRCTADFKTYVGIDVTASKTYVIGQLVPTEDSWKQNDRQLVCVIHASTAGQKTTASAKGTAK